MFRFVDCGINYDLFFCEKLIAGKWTLGPSTFNNAYHLPIVRNQLTRSLTSRLEDITDEIECSFNDLIPPTEGIEPLIPLYSL